MKVKECMNNEVVTIMPEATAAEAVQLMIKHKISSLPVVDEERNLVGFVSRHDLAATADKSLNEFPLDKVMSDRVYSIQSEARLKTALEQMLNNKLNRLPVVSDDKVVGILTRDDIIHHFYGQE
jgi:tRNA nucleotidyltransferase (CCA-adding enzyme)